MAVEMKEQPIHAAHHLNTNSPAMFVPISTNNLLGWSHAGFGVGLVISMNQVTAVITVLLTIPVTLPAIQPGKIELESKARILIHIAGQA